MRAIGSIGRLSGDLRFFTNTDFLADDNAEGG